ncbi:hypothetical protein [Cytobacillus sp. NCCP-133]|uniref:hypothetical protein n=1 Tax=Cytobacillus sp. NCCP-133 TaxID=766848 RepID=UPI00222E5A6D|nr:hypothetical protein [Cytobacillus sp. NCCP-133]GLB59967.1 hypothetical protein NCCP133_20990 [Cytobacillus sp. NCCP-133]
MKLIASHPFIIVSRTIDWNQQQYIEQKHYLHLYEDHIISPTEKFLLDEVWDMSYRSSNSDIGFLYLHTNRGLYSFHVKSEPRQFISLYKELKQ